MSLETKINQDHIQAMKDRDQGKSSCLSFLRAQIKNVKIDKRLEQVPDEEVVSVIKKQVKQRIDSITQFRNAGREDLAVKEEGEMAILKAYLPQEMSAQEIDLVIEEVIKAIGSVTIKDMGRIMKDVMAKTAGKADNAQVGALVKARLAKGT